MESKTLKKFVKKYILKTRLNVLFLFLKVRVQWVYFKGKRKQGLLILYNLINNTNTFYTPFGTNISKSDVVKICIDRIASQCAKLKPRYIKTENDKTVTEKKRAAVFSFKV